MYNNYRDAMVAAERVTANSSPNDIARILRSVGGVALHPRLFIPDELRHVRCWMREGIPFMKIAEIVGQTGLFGLEPQYSIETWAYYNRRIIELQKDVHL